MTPSTNVLFVTKPFGVGGTERVLCDLIARLDLSRVNVTVLCFRLDVYTTLLAGSPVKIITEPEPRSVAGWRKVFRKHLPDALMFVNGNLGVFPLQAYLGARLSGARRVVGFEHLIADPPPESPRTGGIKDILRPFLGLRARLILAMRMMGVLAHATICVSAAVRDRLVADYRYPPSKTLVVRNGVDLVHFSRLALGPNGTRSSLGIGADDPVLLCISRFVPYKRIDVLLAAVSRAVAWYPNLRCVIVGDGPSGDSLRRQALELALDRHVFFVGHRLDVRPFLADADIFVTPSLREGLPLTLLEAMAYELPCVSTDIGGNNEVVIHGQNGLLVAPGSSDALAQAILRLLGNRSERVQMGRNARTYVEERHSIDRTAAAIESILLA